MYLPPGKNHSAPFLYLTSGGKKFCRGATNAKTGTDFVSRQEITNRSEKSSLFTSIYRFLLKQRYVSDCCVVSKGYSPEININAFFILYRDKLNKFIN